MKSGAGGFPPLFFPGPGYRCNPNNPTKPMMIR
ncbi:MAG: hypothetical protein JWP91_165 [Fibrobacteres bacterium]|nr:hypothetical protein [Fibrobacterota bacterium]